MWLFLCLISAITAGFSSIVMKKCSVNNNSKQLTLIGMVISHCVYIVLSIFLTDVIKEFKFINLMKIAPLTIFQMIGYICGILSIKYAKISTVVPIRKCNTIMTLILGIVILGENLPILKLLFSFILIALTILIAKEDTSKNSKITKKGLFFALGFVIFNGTSSFLNKLYINIFGNPLIVTFYYSLVGLFLVAIYCLFTNSWKYLNIKNINNAKYLLLHSALDLTANLCLRYSLVDGKVSIVQVIHSSSIIITILASHFILKENISKKKWIMILGIITCVFFLTLL